jgi:hypothetical protein
MDYIVKDVDGAEQGPLDRDSLVRLVRSLRVTPDCEVRNALVAQWKPAGEIDFLRPWFEAQKKELEKQLASPGGRKKTGAAAKFKNEKDLADAYSFDKPVSFVKTSFEYTHLPCPAPVWLRVAAALYDMALITAFALLLFFVGATEVWIKAWDQTASSKSATPKISREERVLTDEELAAPPKDNPSAQTAPGVNDDLPRGYKRGSSWTDTVTGKTYRCLNPAWGAALWIETGTVNSVFYRYFTVLVIAALMYYGFFLGIKAQTFGMWFWGIFLTGKDISEVLCARAFLFALLLFPLGWLTPFVASVLPSGRAPHDILAGARVIKTAAKPKT